MIIYFIAIFLTIIILIILKSFLPIFKYRDNILILISSLPLSIVAGLRTIDIGTDISVYGRSSFYLATRCSSFKEYYQNVIINYGTESGYAWLNYIVSRFTSNLNIFLFILSLLTIFFAFYGAINFEKLLNIPIEIQITIFFSIIYGTSLNMMRQSFAMSLVFYGTSVLMGDRKYSVIECLTLFLIAFLFHRTAIISLALIVIYWYTTVISHKVRTRITYFILPWMISIIAIRGSRIFEYLIQNTSFSKYTMYLSSDSWLSATSKSFSRIILTTSPAMLATILIVLLLIFSNRYFHVDNDNKRFLAFFGIVLLLDVLTQYTAISGQVISRLGLYFVMFEMVAVPYSIKKFFSQSSTKFIGISIILFYLYLFYHLTIIGTGEIYPYQWIL